MAGLASLGLARFNEAEFAQPPVVYAYGPPKSGVTTLLASILIHTHRVWGLDGVVVISNRITNPYMGNIVPEGLVTDQPLGTVLSKLIASQRHSQASRGSLMRLAVAVDDWFPKESLTHDELVNTIRLLASFNIMLVVGTSDVKKIASLVPVTASHVFATKSNAAADLKLLSKSLFLMCADADEFGEYWNGCSKYEFLVGLLRVDSSADSGGPAATYLRRYSSTYFVKDAASYRDASVLWKTGAAGDAASATASTLPPPYEIASLTFPIDNQAKLVTALFVKH